MNRLAVLSSLAVLLTFNVMADDKSNNVLMSLKQGSLTTLQALKSDETNKVVIQWGKVVDTDATLYDLSCVISAKTNGKKVEIAKNETLKLTQTDFSVANYFVNNSVDVYSYTYSLTNKKQSLDMRCQTTKSSSTIKHLKETLWEVFSLKI